VSSEIWLANRPAEWEFPAISSPAVLARGREANSEIGLLVARNR
jgi:hypothetical protein